jgi:hypothetical protein
MGEKAEHPAAVSISLSAGENGPACEECGGPTPNDPWKSRRTKKRFCSDKCRYRARDRERYAADPEGQREKSRAYYAANRERVIARVRARRDGGAS